MRSIGYCCRYVWKTSPKYIVLLVLVSVLTAAFNVINLLGGVPVTYSVNAYAKKV